MGEENHNLCSVFFLQILPNLEVATSTPLKIVNSQVTKTAWRGGIIS